MAKAKAAPKGCCETTLCLAAAGILDLVAENCGQCPDDPCCVECAKACKAAADACRKCAANCSTAP